MRKARKMHWNYRLIDQTKANDGNPLVELVEAHYEDGKILGTTQVCMREESHADMVSVLEQMIKDINASEVLDEKYSQKEYEWKEVLRRMNGKHLDAWLAGTPLPPPGDSYWEKNQGE